MTIFQLDPLDTFMISIYNHLQWICSFGFPEKGGSTPSNHPNFSNTKIWIFLCQACQACQASSQAAQRHDSESPNLRCPARSMFTFTRAVVPVPCVSLEVTHRSFGERKLEKHVEIVCRSCGGELAGDVEMLITCGGVHKWSYPKIDGLFRRKSHRSKWMITRGTPS